MSRSRQPADELLTTSDVFNPGQFPTHTYKARTTEEAAITKWWADRGKILVVNGPSKTGKTVLVQKLLGQYEPIWIEGHGLNSTEALWSRIADQLGVFTGIQRGSREADQLGTEAEAQVGVSATHVKQSAGYTNITENDNRVTVDRPVEAVAREALLSTERPLVIDDIHFVPREAQEEIIKALKPLVYGSAAVKGRRIVFISIGNRVINVLTNLTDMRARMLPLPVAYWGVEELETIAQDGFGKLRVLDPEGQLANKLATQSFGSPQLMQQLCRELCGGLPNGILHAMAELTELQPPADWTEFFRDQLLDDIEGWVAKLARGPETRGSERNLFDLPDGRSVDAYQLMLLCVANTGPKLKLTKDELRIAMGVVLNKNPPPKTIPTKIVQNMSLIAATKLLEKIPSLQVLRDEVANGYDPYSRADLQPVLEYRSTGPTSEFTITDPFFAFYLAWGLDELLERINAPISIAQSAEEDDATSEQEEWGDLE